MGQTAEELRSDIEQRRQNMSGTVDAIEDRVLPGRIIDRRKRAARTWIHDTRDRVMGQPSPVSDAKERITGVASTMGDTMEQATEKVAEVPAQLAEQTRGAPLIAGGIAFGIGVLLAIVIPETQPERRAVEAMAPQLGAATDAVKEAGQHTLETAKQAAQEAVGDLKETAAEHAGEVTDQAKEAGSEVGRAAEEQRQPVTPSSG